MIIGKTYANASRVITARVTVETDAYYELTLTKAPDDSKVFKASKKAEEAEALEPYATIRIEKPRDLEGRVALEKKLKDWVLVK